MRNHGHAVNEAWATKTGKTTLMNDGQIKRRMGEGLGSCSASSPRVSNPNTRGSRQGGVRKSEGLELAKLGILIVANLSPIFRTNSESTSDLHRRCRRCRHEQQRDPSGKARGPPATGCRCLSRPNPPEVLFESEASAAEAASSPVAQSGVKLTGRTARALSCRSAPSPTQAHLFPRSGSPSSQEPFLLAQG